MNARWRLLKGRVRAFIPGRRSAWHGLRRSRFHSRRGRLWLQRARHGCFVPVFWNHRTTTGSRCCRTARRKRILISAERIGRRLERIRCGCQWILGNCGWCETAHAVSRLIAHGRWRCRRRGCRLPWESLQRVNFRWSERIRHRSGGRRLGPGIRRGRPLTRLTGLRPLVRLARLWPLARLRLGLSQHGDEFELADPDLVTLFQPVLVSVADGLIGIVDEGAIDTSVFQIDAVRPHIDGSMVAGNETFRIR